MEGNINTNAKGLMMAAKIVGVICFLIAVVKLVFSVKYDFQSVAYSIGYYEPFSYYWYDLFWGLSDLTLAIGSAFFGVFLIINKQHIFKSIGAIMIIISQVIGVITVIVALTIYGYFSINLLFLIVTYICLAGAAALLLMGTINQSFDKKNHYIVIMALLGIYFIMSIVGSNNSSLVDLFVAIVIAVGLASVAAICLLNKSTAFESAGAVMVNQQPYVEKTKPIYRESNEPVQNTTINEGTVALLKDYKELLDMGALTQEEFDKKKKELLGL